MAFYKDGVISIPNVTGDVVITASAVQTWQPRIPSEYQEVEWIGFDGNSGLYFHSSRVHFSTDNDMKIYAKFSCPDYLHTRYMDGFVYNGRAVSHIISHSGNTGLLAAIGTGTYSGPILEPNSVYEMETTWHEGVNSKINLDGHEISNISSEFDVAIPYATYAFSIGSYGAPYSFIGAMYEYWIKLDGNYEIHMIPCYRKSNNEIGMYDMANDIFYTNNGTGAFTKGPDVTR